MANYEKSRATKLKKLYKALDMNTDYIPANKRGKFAVANSDVLERDRVETLSNQAQNNAIQNSKNTFIPSVTNIKGSISPLSYIDKKEEVEEV